MFVARLRVVSSVSPSELKIAFIRSFFILISGSVPIKEFRFSMKRAASCAVTLIDWIASFRSPSMLLTVPMISLPEIPVIESFGVISRISASYL